jgi:polyhydroxybutyrate depolymerase
LATLAPVVVALLALAACGGGSKPTEPIRAAVQHKELTVAGQARGYRLFAPPSLDPRSRPPLVIVLGGFGNTAESMVGATEFDREATDGGFVVAYPDGIKETWNAGYCCGSAARDRVDDVAFLVAVIDQVQAEYKSDPARVYLVGVSNGAMMAYRMACELAGRVTGVGSVAGAMTLEGCLPTRAVAVIEIHGTADPLVPYDGGATAGGATQPSPPTPAVVHRWASLDHCSPEPVTEVKGPVTTSTWPGCAAGAAVKLLTIDGGGHTWFAPGLGPANGAVNATHEIWSFFSNLRPGG